MAIPIRVTITCPACKTSEGVLFADTSVGPHGRTSQAPTYCMFRNDLWSQSRRDTETHLTCTTCGEVDFTTLTALAATQFSPRKQEST